MARQARNEITITDVNDGTNPITGFMSNANHTFVANTAGTVSAVASFSSTLNVFVGSVQATYVASIGTTANTFTITGVSYVGTPMGWGTPARSNDTITIPSIAQSHATEAVIRVTYSVRTPTTTLTGLTVDISLSIVTEGAGGAVVQLTPNRQTFTADPSGTADSGQGAVEIGVAVQGNVGNLTVQVSQNGGAYVTRTSTNAGQGHIAGFDTDETGAFQTGTIPTSFARLQITSANLGTNDSMAIRVVGASAGTDTVNVFKVRQGTPGEDAIIVSLTSSDGTVFRNAAGNAKVLTATVTDAGTGMTPTGTLTYTWTRANGTPVRVTSATDRTVVSSGGVLASGTAFTTITVGPEDVTGQERFGVFVEES